MQAAERRGSARATAILATLSALAFALSFPLSATFVAGWPLAFAWPAFLALAVLRAPRPRTLVPAVGVPFFLAFLAHEWWMRHITELGMPVLVLYLTGWTVVLALVLRALVGQGGRRWPMALALPVTLVSIECLRGELVCSGYAWFFTAHPLVEWTTIAQVAAFGGGWMVTALAALVAGAAVDIWTRADRARILSPIVALTMLALAIGYGTARIAAVDARIARATDTPHLLVVQTNLPMSNKLDWPPDAQIEDFLAFARLTIDGARAARSGGSDPDGASRLTAALWPETMLPGLGLEPESIKTLVDGGYYPGNRYEEAMRDLATRIDAPLLVGSPAYLGLRVEGNRFRWSEQFNSAYLVGADGVLGRTDKIYLTPFGETMPIISNSDWLEAQLLALGADGMTFDLEAAAQPQVLAVPARDGAAAVMIGVPICFEITQAWASRRIVFAEGKRVAGIAVNLSNDGWFGPSRAGRRQHLQVAQLRAIELDTPVVRCVNTGISASIDAAGRVLEGLAPETDGSFVATPTPSTGVPPSYWLTNATSFTALGLLAIGLIRTRRDFEAVAAVPIV